MSEVVKTRTSAGPAAAGKKPAEREFVKAYRIMLTARVLEEKLAALYRAGKIKGGVFLGRGQEALSVSVGINLRRGDIFAPLIRDQAGRMAFGDTILDTLRTYLGSSLGSNSRVTGPRWTRAADPPSLAPSQAKPQTSYAEHTRRAANSSRSQ